jgi:glycosyltransferase involved in cell wall biosynthesis
MSAPLKVLCLDIEGGHGGSSRSLYFSLKHVDRDLIAPTVVCRRGGAIVERYQALGIPVHVMPHLPKANPVPRLSRNVLQAIDLASDVWRHRADAQALNSIVMASDLIHFNHEGFAWLAAWVRRHHGKPATMHLRTNTADSVVTRLQARVISSSVDAVVCITDNECATFRGHGGTTPAEVIFNIVEPLPPTEPHPALIADGRFTIVSIANAALVRGTDRLLDIAESLRGLGREDVRIAVAGDMRLTGRWPGDLDCIARVGGTLADAAAARGLSSWFLFLGHVAEPERVLVASDLLVKPTRDDNPWGRDIIEAMAAGLPVASIGRDATFVETRVTGLLQSRFDAMETATFVGFLANHRSAARIMGLRARERALLLCDGRSRAADLAAVWRRIAGGNDRQGSAPMPIYETRIA